MKRIFNTVFAGLFLLGVAPALAQQAADAIAPEQGGSGALALSDAVAASQAAKAAGQPVLADDWMIVAANPYAAQAGARVLRAGGSAADAAVAVQLVLGLVEPQSSGLGGGAFVVWFDAATGTLTTLDGRETAPLAVTPRLFQDAAGEPLKFFDAVVGGRSVGTPGTPAVLELLHRKWGRLDWAGLFDDALMLARDGFTVSDRMAQSIARDADRLSRFAATADYFLPGGQPLQAGQTLSNPAYAETLAVLAENGAGAFYTGDIAADIVRTVRTAAGNPGVLSQTDLAIYQAKERPTVCAPYRTYQVCGMGPPSSGALTVGQILGMAQQYDLSAGPDDPETLRILGDASRLAFADRGRYMADEDFVPMPTQGLLDPSYVQSRAALLSGPRLTEVAPGTPKFDHAANWADDEAIELPSTSHISIVDRYGNALSMTTTIENGFGSRLFVRGFLLNNELTDFSFRTHKDGLPIANRVEPGKRPRSSMSPTIVMQNGKPVLVTGAPGGSMIIGFVANSILAWADWGMNVQQAVSQPHRINRFGRYDVEEGSGDVETAQALEAMGYAVKITPMTSGLGAIEIGPRLSGGADPRREGIALGE
ncbi:gamma-glutamyltranspeptidase / glutathione hydrolase [Thalassovita litoralis]|jgi:gamma-glutamyltranspeptidase/glutathione hydrolase|uniref:Glutathione hydrolase proenzyme n=1 Tax=Thalassovita litoralis TaxID=1010611 RepID=A0A521FTS8_9RHOB|nr:gamma-glutamyltransferase [Thalassovita litoralis]SMO99563.1 gamma-glutamyltranspeptidase / glutathione hydrolase [Thalassovita litoralis]